MEGIDLSGTVATDLSHDRVFIQNRLGDLIDAYTGDPTPTPLGVRGVAMIVVGWQEHYFVL